MKKNFSLLLVLTLVAGFSVDVAAATVETLINPSSKKIKVNGITHVPTHFSLCANLSAASLVNGYYYCPKAVGKLKAAQVSVINGTDYRDNPATSSIKLSGTKYVPSDYSICNKFTLAREYNGYYWCKSKTGLLSAAKVDQLEELVAALQPEPVPEPAPTTTPQTTPTTPSISGSTPPQVVATQPTVPDDAPPVETPVETPVVTPTPPAVVPAPAPVVPVTYTASLSWTAPSTREDGSPLAMSDLKGYELYYTNDSLSQSVTVPISIASATTYSVANLSAGTYHFAISAIDSKGLKSQLSPMVSTTFK